MPRQPILHNPLTSGLGTINYNKLTEYCLYVCLRVIVLADVEKRFGVSVQSERENRAYMTGPDHGIHPLANGAGKGLKTELRETDFPSSDPLPRVFV